MSDRLDSEEFQDYVSETLGNHKEYRMSRVAKDPSVEIRDRLRRIETRVTRMMLAAGIPERVDRPEFKHGELRVPSPQVSLADIVASVPPGAYGTDIRISLRGAPDVVIRVG